MEDSRAAYNLKRILSDIGDRRLVAVTKNTGTDGVGYLFDAGHRVFGESRVKDAEPKIKVYPDAEWHMIGHLQGNKVRDAVRLFGWIDSIDSLKLAEKVSRECSAIGKTMDILVQVNIGNEEKKHGFAVDEAVSAALGIAQLHGMRIRGLMAIAPDVEAEKTRPYFREMKKLFKMIKKEIPTVDTLSMGMSNDYKVAIEEGSTMVRIGTALWR